jgi:hypothetical protein
MQAFSATAGLELSERCFLTHDGVVSLQYEQFLFKYCLNIPTHHRDDFFLSCTLWRRPSWKTGRIERLHVPGN